MQQFMMITPHLFLLAPLVFAMLSICGLERFIFSRFIKPTRNYKCLAWYLAALPLFAFWPIVLCVPEKYIASRYEGVVACIAFGSFTVALSLVAIGIWQPLWKAKDCLHAGFLRLIPALLVLAALLGTPSLFFCNLMWPIGYFGIAPLTLVGLLLLVISAVPQSGQEPPDDVRA